MVYPRRFPTDQEERAFVQPVLDGEMSCAELADLTEVPASTITRWVRKYRDPTVLQLRPPRRQFGTRNLSRERLVDWRRVAKLEAEEPGRAPYCSECHVALAFRTEGAIGIGRLIEVCPECGREKHVHRLAA